MEDLVVLFVCFSPLISLSVCPDKSNTSRLGDEEVAISGYVTLPCSAFLLRNFSFYPQRVSAKIRTPLVSKYALQEPIYKVVIAETPWGAASPG